MNGKNPIVPGGVIDSNTGTANLVTPEQPAIIESDSTLPTDVEEKIESPTSNEPLANTIILTEDDTDVEYSLNENGDAVKDGKVVYTADELKAFGESSETTPEFTISDIADISGISILNSDGTPKEYDLSIESLAQREADIFELGKRQANEEAVSEFFKMNPDIYQATLYKQTYGSLDGFANHVDWSTMKLDDKSEDQLESVIRTAEKRKGTSDAAIARIIKFSKADKVLEEAATESLNYLANVQKQEQLEAANRQDEADRKAQEASDKTYGITYENGKAKVLNIKGSLYDKIVNDGKLGGLSIPTSGVKTKINGKETTLTRKDLVRYITEPAIEHNGEYYTAAQKAVMNMLSNDETFAMIAIRNLLGEDINQLAEATIRQATVKRLNVTSKNKPIVKVSSNNSSNSINPNRRPIIPGGAIDSK